MDYKNTISVRLSKGHMVVQDGLFQYDYGQRLILKGVDLPESYEVHFSNDEHGESKTSIGDNTGVDIPDEYLLSGSPVYFWVFLHNEETDGYTEYSGQIRVTKRAKPTDLDPTPVQQDVITQVVAVVNNTSNKVTTLQGDLDQLRQDFDNFEETDPTVPSWAKKETKPSYTPQEIGALPNNTFIPSKVSDLTNDSGYLSVETDPTVPEWAKQPTKPSYTPQEVGALPSDTYIPNKVSDLTNDSGYISVEVDPTVPSWAKQPTKPSYTPQEVGALPNDTFIPSKVSDLTNDEGYLTTETDPTVPQWAKQPTKPSYTSQEVGALPSNTFIPSNVSDLNDDVGILTEEVDPTVPNWAKQPNKPSYTAQEVGALPNSTVIPSKTSDLTNDSGFISNETDPTVPSWAKQPNKPTYTAQEVGALPNSTAIPSKVSDLQNDSGFIAQETDPTVPSWAKQSTKPSYTAAEVGATTTSEVNSLIATAIGDIHSFDVSIVQSLPTQDIKTHTIYFVPKTGETNDVYDEYIYVNNAWEMIGNTQIDLSDYATKDEIPDVQINGSSIVSNGIANIPFGDNNNLGAVKTENNYGIFSTSGTIKIDGATDAQIKNSNSAYRPIVPNKQHQSVFYGLAKAAGDTTQSASNNEVGTYTNEAKAAIKTMIGIEDPEVQDVQVNGTSVVQNGMADIPVASTNNYGAIKLGYGFYTSQTTGQTSVSTADLNQIKAGSSGSIYVPLNRLHEATFYGLAKAAGEDMSSSSNAVGTYTDNAKSAIKTMLGVIDPAVTDVQVNGTSILQNGIANVPVASTNDFGVVKVGVDTYGILIAPNGNIRTVKATLANIKSGNNGYQPITSDSQHQSVFYGLAKAAGDSTQSSSSNTVGTYTSEAKQAIQNMLDVPSTNDMNSTIIIDDTEPEESTNKLWIDTGDILNEYSVPTIAEMNTALSGKVSDVQINSSSIIQNNTANIPIGNNSGTLGVVKGSGYGVRINASGELYVSTGSITNEVKGGVSNYLPIVPSNQHASVFYGLAKLAGADMANSSNTVGVYTNEAKVAIQKMLGTYEAPWELIREDEFTNATEADHIITVDGNGQPFELTDAIMLFELTENSNYSSKGYYGQIWFYYDNETKTINPEPGAFSRNAGTEAKGAWYRIQYNNGLVVTDCTGAATNTNSGYLRFRFIHDVNQLADSAMGIFVANEFSMTKVNIRMVTGTGHYKLYGRRKWT